MVRVCLTDSVWGDLLGGSGGGGHGSETQGLVHSVVVQEYSTSVLLLSLVLYVCKLL